ncbi:hypothetical protein [Leptospira licerasiae]|uniref:hypothetical protein n=1 Tax=Leptospira licerasiae TaxID=447106 RepID=UPI0010825BF1|nr:hypothetical protein [Leptospira licerasiae]TGM87927.1 hypothetical protein EHR05_14850 [Leptospira licerasiae]
MFKRRQILKFFLSIFNNTDDFRSSKIISTLKRKINAGNLVRAQLRLSSDDWKTFKSGSFISPIPFLLKEPLKRDGVYVVMEVFETPVFEFLEIKGRLIRQTYHGTVLSYEKIGKEYSVAEILVDFRKFKKESPTLS